MPEYVQFIPLLLWTIIIFVPCLFILQRTGMSRWWSVLCFVPPFLGFLALLYIVAFSRWPKENAPR